MGVLTVSAIKPTFGSDTGAGPSGSYARCSRRRGETGWSRCSDDCFPTVLTSGTDPSATFAVLIWMP